MALRKLDHEEQLLISKQIEKLKELNQAAIANNVKGYSYDWMELEKALSFAITSYSIILNSDKRGIS